MGFTHKKIASKILNIIGIMYRLKHMVLSEILLTIYNGLIKPHILYGLKCWGFNQERILKLQKKAMRIISLSGYFSHSEPLFKKLNVLKIDGMFKLQLLTFCFDLINNNLPAYFINMSSHSQPVIYHHNIRQKRNYSVAQVKHVFAQKCMRFCIPDILNKSSSIVTDKIQTHRRKGFSVYLKCFLVNAYNSICLIPNCYICSKLLFRNTRCTWTLALFGPIFGQGEGYYIRSYYYILYPCSPLILTFLIYLICVSVFALIHRLHSYLSASPSALMLLFNYWPSFCLSVFPATYAVFQKLYILLY